VGDSSGPEVETRSSGLTARSQQTGRLSYGATVDARVRAAIDASHLRELPDDLVEELLAGATGKAFPAGSMARWEGDTDPLIELVVSGLVRVFVTAPDGRTLTVRYCRPGALMGVFSVFVQRFVLPASTQALVDAELLQISPVVTRQLAARDGRVAMALLADLSERVQSFVAEIPGSAFTSVRQRVARHLLDLASQRMSEHGELVVLVSQRDLAEAVGTVREVVVRVLRELRQEGVVRTERDRIVVVDPARLIHGQRWNPSP
jgi:CRP/FNR family transcriptional regulator, cyclic AMP receptor protein